MVRRAHERHLERSAVREQARQARCVPPRQLFICTEVVVSIHNVHITLREGVSQPFNLRRCVTLHAAELIASGGHVAGHQHDGSRHLLGAELHTHRWQSQLVE